MCSLVLLAATAAEAPAALDGRPQNGKLWFFYGGLSDVEYTVTLTDTVTGESRAYRIRRAACAAASTSTLYRSNEVYTESP